MTEHELLQIFRETGALLEGHFILRSGLHSRQYFQCALAFQQMPVVEKVGGALAGKVGRLNPATVIAPAMGGYPPVPRRRSRHFSGRGRAVRHLPHGVRAWAGIR